MDAIFQRYCPVLGRGMPVCASWDGRGRRRERCLGRGECIRRYGGCRCPAQLERAAFGDCLRFLPNHDKLQQALHKRQAVGHTTRKGVSPMRLTIHIGRFTVTIIVKSRDRHSAK